MSDSDDPKPKPFVASRREREDSSMDAQDAGRERPSSHQLREDPHRCLTPIHEHIGPQYKVNIAEAHTGKGYVKKDLPPKDNNTMRHILIGTDKAGNNTLFFQCFSCLPPSTVSHSYTRSHGRYALNQELMTLASGRSRAHYSPTASQETTVLPKPPVLEPHVPDATSHVPDATPHVPIATLPQAPPPHTYQYHNSDNEEMGGAARKRSKVPGDSSSLKRGAKGQGYGSMQQSFRSGGEVSPRTHASQTSATQLEVQNEHPVVPQPLTVGHDPPGPPNAGDTGLPPQQEPAVLGRGQLQLDQEAELFPPRTRVQKCRCYCVWYTILFTILCSVAIAVWTTAISPSKKIQNYVTSLDEVMKLDANSYTTGLLTVQAHDWGPDCSTNTLTAYHLPCSNLSFFIPYRRSHQSQHEPTTAPAIRVNDSQMASQLGLSHYVFYMEEGGTLNITALSSIYINTSLLIEFIVFNSTKHMYDCENRTSCATLNPMELGVDSISFYIEQGKLGGSTTPYNATFTGHHYMSTKLSVTDDITYPFNLSFRFVLITRTYNTSVPGAEPHQCHNCVCRVPYSWFPWEVFHPSCVLLRIHGTPVYEKYSTLYQIQQTSHRRTDMIGYFVAFIVVTLIGLFVVHSYPIYRKTRDCLRHRYTRRVRHYIGLF